MSLLDNDTPAETARAVIADAQRALAHAEAPSAEVVNAAVIAALAKRLPCQPGIPTPSTQGDNRPLTIALVGPTGVGKTTTIAKLAATYKLRFGARVALVTCDTYRIAAVDQLRTYANIIGIPVRVAVTPDDLRCAVDDLRHEADVILVDTAGRSHHDDNHIHDLAHGLEALDPHQTHLVLSASLAPRVLNKAAAPFAEVNPSHLTLTKLDEAETLGPVLALLDTLKSRGSSPAIAYVTTGQQVPEQIDLASPQAIATRVLGVGAQVDTRVDAQAGAPVGVEVGAETDTPAQAPRDDAGTTGTPAPIPFTRSVEAATPA